MIHREISLQDKYILKNGKVFVTGVQALVRLPLEQRDRDIRARINSAGFISGYRGSPLGTYDMQLLAAKKFLDEKNIHLWTGLNEDLGATAVWGSQQLGLFSGAKVDGVFGIWYGKAPGVDRTGDAFKHANFAGTSKFGGALAIAGDDHSCKSSTLPAQSEFAFMDAEIPVLCPSSIQDVLDYGLYGIAMSRFTGSWVGLIAIADTMDSGAVIDISQDRFEIEIPKDFALPEGGLSIRRNDDPMQKEARLRAFKLPAAMEFVRANNLNKIVLGGKNRKIGIVATGQAYRDCLEALAAMGIDLKAAEELGLSVLKVAMPWPLEPEGIKNFAKGLETILVVEHKRALMEPQIKSILYGLKDVVRPNIIGKLGLNGKPLLSDVAVISIPQLGQAILDLLPKGEHTKSARAWLKIANASMDNAKSLEGDSQRKPHFCSGCPHNTSTKVPEGSRALAGIGCHYMANYMPDRPTDMTSQMGGEGVGWIGQARFTDEEHVFANLGDGTYSHSGSLAIRAAISAGVNITYKLLYNDAVAMTGGQATESGQSVPQIAKQLLGEGVAEVVVVADDITRYDGIYLGTQVGLFDRRKLGEIQNRLKKTKGVTVIIYDQICATEKRRRIKRGLLPAVNTRTFINPAVCEGCGDCSVQSNCLSIHPLETEFGTKRQIDQSSCNQDFRCVDGFCPSFVTVEGAVNAKKLLPRPEFDASKLPLPTPHSLEKPFSIIFAGVGGTGVTTASAIIGMAAHVDGKGASTLDMTGLAQKGGQVLSHIRIARTPEQIHSGRVPIAMADAAIIGDLIVATNLDALNLVSKTNTIAVANTDIAPTSEFVLDRNRRYRSVPKVELFSKAVKAIDTINAEAIANEYLYDAMYSNMVIMGFAWQKGLIPISLRGLYRAIKLNGVAIENNMLAFDLGRIYAHDRGRLKELVPERAPPKKKTLDELIEHRGQHLEGYQGRRYRNKYENFINECRILEQSKTGSDDLTAIVAANLSKLMSYKDEYEVARLYSDKKYWDALHETLAGEKRVSLWLAPPLFAAKDPITGHGIKRKFGPWVFDAMRVLKNFKFLRGTWFDPFGFGEERRAQRKLLAMYKADVETILEKLTPENKALAIQIVRIPEEIRGFGHVLEAAMEKAAKRREKLLAEFEG